MNTLATWALAALALTTACGASAQSASAPTKVGVSASDAAAAEKKAAADSSVGTVVRTGPDATDKAKSMTKDNAASGQKKAASPAGGASRATPAKAD